MKMLMPREVKYLEKVTQLGCSLHLTMTLQIRLCQLEFGEFLHVLGVKLNSSPKTAVPHMFQLLAGLQTWLFSNVLCLRTPPLQGLQPPWSLSRLSTPHP